MPEPTQVSKGPQCIGHSETKGKCQNVATNPPNPSKRFGGGPFWCDRCEQIRRAYLDAQFAKLQEYMNNAKADG